MSSRQTRIIASLAIALGAFLAGDLWLDRARNGIAIEPPKRSRHPGRPRGRDLRGRDLREARWADADLRQTDLREAHLTRADLRRANLRQALMDRAHLDRADLTRADLTRAYLANADLTRATLAAARLDEAWLQDACLEGADLRRARLRGAKLRGADLRGAWLEGADLRGAWLSRAVLDRAILAHADLSGADLSLAGLGDTDLRGALFRGTNLEGAWLIGRAGSVAAADLRGSRYDERTRWPAGFDPKTRGGRPDTKGFIRGAPVSKPVKRPLSVGVTRRSAAPARRGCAESPPARRKRPTPHWAREPETPVPGRAPTRSSGPVAGNRSLDREIPARCRRW